MDDEAHARICRCVHERLALVEHCDRVPGHQEQSINALQRRRKGSCVVELEIDCLFAFQFPRFHLLLFSGCAHDLDICRPAIESESDCSARQAARAKHQDPILPIAFKHFHDYPPIKRQRSLSLDRTVIAVV